MDANYKFLWLNIGTRGAAGDAQIWNESPLKHALVNNTLPIPQPESLPHDTTDIPYYLIGDDAFGLVYLFILFIWGFTSLSTLYRSYHDG